MKETRALDVEQVRSEFPVLKVPVHGHPLVYFDSAASAQKPQVVIDAMLEHYRNRNANVHRGVHYLSQEASLGYEAARGVAARFLNAGDQSQVIFAHGTTSALNLVARSYGDTHVKQGDHILVSELEHHSNIVPWQQLAQRRGARVIKVPVTDTGEIDLDEFRGLLSDRTKIVAVSHASNVLGTITPVSEIAALSHAVGAVLVVDGAQSAPHLPIDVSELNCDFFACSGHKLYAPTGVGLLWGRGDILEAMPPYEGGGGMIDKVTFEKTTYAKPPARFEAGTPPIEGAIGLAAALEWLRSLDSAAVVNHEEQILAYAVERLVEIPGLRILGNPSRRVSVLSFVIDGIHPHDIGTILDANGIAIRAGHHCAQPLMHRFGVVATARVSFCPFNTTAEVDLLIDGLRKVKELFG